MKTLFAVLLFSAVAMGQLRAGLTGGMPVNMGHKYPQVGGVISFEHPRFEFSGTLLSIRKLDGGWGVSGVNSAKLCLNRFDLGVRHSWLKVEQYSKQAVRPFVAVGQYDLNFKYVWWGTDKFNHLQSVLFEVRKPLDPRWRVGFEAGPTFFHATNNPAQRHVGFVMSISFERRI